MLAVGGISVATLMWDHHSNHGRVLATLGKSFSALGKLLFGGANEKSAKADEGTSETKSPPKKKSPGADGRRITDGILQGKSGISVATSDVQDSEADQSELGTVEISFEEDPQQLDEKRFIGEYPYLSGTSGLDVDLDIPSEIMSTDLRNFEEATDPSTGKPIYPSPNRHS